MEVFNELIATKANNALLISSEVRGLKSLDQRLLRVVEESIFPSREDDYRFFSLVWPMIGEDFENSAASQTKDGYLFTRLMREEVSFEDFLCLLIEECFLRRTRVEIYQNCKMAVESLSAYNNPSYKILQSLYDEKGRTLLTENIQTGKPEVYTRVCEKFYVDLGYNFVDGNALNGNSLFVMASDGRLPLMPSTFNLGLLPWTLDDSISLRDTEPPELKEFGWTREAIAAALQIDEGNSTRRELVSLYRDQMGTDVYIDWSQVKKYHYLDHNSLRIIALKTFGVGLDVTDDLLYDEILSRLVTMSNYNEALPLEQLASDALRDVGGYVSGEYVKGPAYLYRTEAQSIDKSFWYPNLSGDICFMYNGVLIPDYMLPVDYRIFVWASERTDRLSPAFYILIAQRLGLWKLIQLEAKEISPEYICERIESWIIWLETNTH